MIYIKTALFKFYFMYKKDMNLTIFIATCSFVYKFFPEKYKKNLYIHFNIE